jgi:hypothetical protein
MIQIAYEYLCFRRDFLTFPSGDDIQIYILIWNYSLGHRILDECICTASYITSETLQNHRPFSFQRYTMFCYISVLLKCFVFLCISRSILSSFMNVVK